MTDDEIPRTAEAFDERLSELVRTAADNGVVVEGGWDVQGTGDRDWSVEITRVRSDD